MTCTCEDKPSDSKSIICSRCGLQLKEIVSEVVNAEPGPGIGLSIVGAMVRLPSSDDDVD